MLLFEYAAARHRSLAIKTLIIIALAVLLRYYIIQTTRAYWFETTYAIVNVEFHLYRYTGIRSVHDRYTSRQCINYKTITVIRLIAINDSSIVPIILSFIRYRRIVVLNRVSRSEIEV